MGGFFLVATAAATANVCGLPPFRMVRERMGHPDGVRGLAELELR
jgi:hypothetical protein